MKSLSSSIRIRVKGVFESIKTSDVIRFYPWMKTIHKYVIDKSGWRIRYFECTGEAYIEVNLEKAVFDLEHRFELEAGEHRYVLRISFHEKDVGNIDIVDLVECKVSFDYHDLESIIIAEIPSKTITRILDPIWYSPKGEKLSFIVLYDIIDIIKYLIDKGFKLTENASTSLTHIMELTRSPKLKLVIDGYVIEPDKVPSFEELLDELTVFFKERGIIVKIERKRTRSLS